MLTDQGLPFAVLLRRFRGAAGLTQEALAERAGISARAVSDLERGAGRLPRSTTLQILATALGLNGADRATFVVSAQPVPSVQALNSFPYLVPAPVPTSCLPAGPYFWSRPSPRYRSSPQPELSWLPATTLALNRRPWLSAWSV